ncbi:unnamed protein product [Ectocarpus fasciculatus]
MATCFCSVKRRGAVPCHVAPKVQTIVLPQNHPFKLYVSQKRNTLDLDATHAVERSIEHELLFRVTQQEHRAVAVVNNNVGEILISGGVLAPTPHVFSTVSIQLRCEHCVSPRHLNVRGEVNVSGCVNRCPSPRRGLRLGIYRLASVLVLPYFLSCRSVNLRCEVARQNKIPISIDCSSRVHVVLVYVRTARIVFL